MGPPGSVGSTGMGFGPPMIGAGMGSGIGPGNMMLACGLIN